VAARTSAGSTVLCVPETDDRAMLARHGAGRLPVLLQRLDPELPAPDYAHPGDAGVDVYARHDVVLAPGERAVVATGVALALPDGYAAFAHPRSGLAARCGVSLVNAPGTIDAGYRGEVQVVLVNLDPRQPVSLRRGDRVAQLVFQRVERARFVEVERLPGSSRGARGFGSSGGTTALDAGGERDATVATAERD
jgi:dUTP pyrophosphatase